MPVPASSTCSVGTPSTTPDGQLDLATGGGVADRVVDQVADQQAQCRFVAFDEHRLLRHARRAAAVLLTASGTSSAITLRASSDRSSRLAAIGGAPGS